MKYLYVAFSMLLVGIMLLSLPAYSDKKATLRGWISDENCGALHTKPGREDCIRKCRRGGASAGHPEWLPQRLVLVSDSDQKIWIIENPESLDGREGRHVEVRAILDLAKASIQISRVEEIQSSAKP